MQPNTPFPVKPENSPLELTSPRANPENLGMMAQVRHGFRPSWPHVGGHRNMPDYGPRNPDHMYVGLSPRGITGSRLSLSVFTHGAMIDLIYSFTS